MLYEGEQRPRRFRSLYFVRQTLRGHLPPKIHTHNTQHTKGHARGETNYRGTSREEDRFQARPTLLLHGIPVDSTAVARSSLWQQDIVGNCGQLVRLGEWWAASPFFFCCTSAAGWASSFSFSRSVGCYTDFERGPYFFWRTVKIRNSRVHSSEICLLGAAQPASCRKMHFPVAAQFVSCYTFIPPGAAQYAAC